MAEPIVQHRLEPGSELPLILGVGRAEFVLGELQGIAVALEALHLAPGSGQAMAADGIAMHGSPRETAGFTHFPYVNPDAPKGGRVTFAMQGSYDSLNPLIVKGEPADGVRDYVYESLLARAGRACSPTFFHVPLERAAVSIFQ